MPEHHALLYIDKNKSLSVLPAEWQQQSADVLHVATDSFGVGDARALAQSATVRPVENTERVFVIITETMTIEAQNALLKLFEDPPETARFVLLVADAGWFLPTLRSRLLLAGATEEENVDDVFVDFLSLSYAERIEMINQKNKAKDVAWMNDVVSGAGQWSAKNKVGTNTLKSLLLVDNYIKNRGASKKMLLEELALSLPVS